METRRMGGKGVVLGLLVLVFVMSMPVFATPIYVDIYSDMAIPDGRYNRVRVYDSQDIPPVQTTVAITGGEIDVLNAYDTSKVIIENGIFGAAYLYDNSQMHVYGGAWGDGTDIDIFIKDNSELHIYGYQLEHDDNYELFGRTLNAVTGYWENDQEFILLLGTSSVNNFTLHEIPEPAAIILLTFGGLLLRRNCR